MVEDDAWDLTVDQGAAWVCRAYSPRSLTRFMPTLRRRALECTPVAGLKPTNSKKTEMGQLLHASDGSWSISWLVLLHSRQTVI